MALQDLKPENAAELVLGSLASGLSKGVRQNLAYDLKEQPMWEAFDTPAYHQPIFTAAVLLNRAFPKVYPRPEIARLILKLALVVFQGARSRHKYFMEFVADLCFLGCLEGIKMSLHDRNKPFHP